MLRLPEAVEAQERRRRALAVGLVVAVPVVLSFAAAGVVLAAAMLGELLGGLR